MNIEDNNQDIQWFKKKCQYHGLGNPSDASQEAFAEKVSIIIADSTDSRPPNYNVINQIREGVFEMFVDGELL